MHRYGNSIGKGAGCPILCADSGRNLQMLFVYSRNSSFVIVLLLPLFSLLNFPFEKISMYSCVSLSVGLDGEHQLPQAVDEPAPAPLSQITSPLIRNPAWVMVSMMCL